MADTADLKYTREHEWIALDGDTATIGITDYAADQLGDVVYVDLPAVGSTIEGGKVVGEIESTKSVGELFAPVDGTVVEANQAVIDNPQLVNEDPFGQGWMLKITIDPSALGATLTQDEYRALVAE